MISSVHIQRFMCLRDVQVSLGPLTVLVGKNDTGKSSFLRALMFLRSFVGDRAHDLRRSGLERLVWRGDVSASVCWDLKIAATPRNGLAGQGLYSLELTAAGDRPRVRHEKFVLQPDNGLRAETFMMDQGGMQRVLREPPAEPDRSSGDVDGASAFIDVHRARSRFPSLARFVDVLASTTLYRLDPQWIARPSGYVPDDPIETADEPTLRHDGYGLPAVLDHLVGAKRAIFDRIEAGLKEAVPFVKSVQVRRWVEKSENGKASLRRGKAIHFEQAVGGDVSTDLTSDGVMLYLAYLTLVHGPAQPSLILLEEPENGIHPRQLQRVVNLFRQVTAPDASGAYHGPQIILTTHSPYLLDFVPADCVRVFGRKASGETVVAPLPKLPGVNERLAAGLSVGELWFNIGEDRLLGDLLK